MKKYAICKRNTFTRVAFDKWFFNTIDTVHLALLFLDSIIYFYLCK